MSLNEEFNELTKKQKATKMEFKMRAIMLKHGSSFIRRNDMNAYRSSLAGGGSGGDGADYTVTFIKDGIETIDYSSCANCLRNSQNNNDVIIGARVGNVANLLYNAENFNRDIIIPESVNDCSGMLCYAYNFSANIYVMGKTYRNINIAYMLYGSSKIRKVYFNHVLNNIFNQTGPNALIGSITWETADNCFFNTDYNIYCYYNFAG